MRMIILVVAFLVAPALMPVWAAPLTDGEAVKLSQAQLLDHLRNDLPAAIAHARRQNTRGMAPFEPDAPATLAYYTKARVTPWKGLCAAQKLSVSYDTSGSIANLDVQPIFNVNGPVAERTDFPVIDDQSCLYASSSDFFPAPDVKTASMVAAIIQQLDSDEKSGVTPAYSLGCLEHTPCETDELKGLRAGLPPRRISSARFVTCDRRYDPAAGADAQGHFCLEILLNDTLRDYDRIIAEGLYSGRDYQIKSIQLGHGGRVY